MNTLHPSNSAPLPSQSSPQRRNTPERRKAEHQALRALADEVLRLNREAHRGRSYAEAHYNA